MALFWAALPVAFGMKLPASPAPAAAGTGNSMTQTYGFLRTASNNVGNTVETVIGIEDSLEDMGKDLDEEYKRWMQKKLVLTQEGNKFKSEIAKLKRALQEQKKMDSERERIQGEVAMKQVENRKIAAETKERAARQQLEKKGMEEDIEALQCQTKAIQQVKQERVDLANKKTAQLKNQNRILQEAVFRLNKEVMGLAANASEAKIKNKAVTSGLLAKIEAVQKQIHGLETQLVAQAQLEETVQRARERLATQSAQTVRQREKLTEAQAKCMMNKKQMEKDIEASKAKLNAATQQMVQCQIMDGQNQQMQTQLNSCLMKKRDERLAG